MRRPLRLLGALAVGAALAAVLDSLIGGARIAKLGSLADRMHSWLHDSNEAGAASLRPRVAFEWVTLDRDAAALRAAFPTVALPFVMTDPADGAAREQIVTRKLTAIGMHFDQEPGRSPDRRLARASGAVTIGQLESAIEHFLERTTEGLIVDTTSHVVEIDEHTDLGAGAIVVIEPSGAHQLRSGSRRLLVAALDDAAQRGLPLGFRPLPDLPALRHELAHFPRSVDDLLVEVGNGPIPGGPLSYERAERLGALRRCDQCRAPIVDLGTMSELVAEFYGAPERRQDVALTLVQSGVEVGDLLSPNFCSAHGQIAPTSN